MNEPIHIKNAGLVLISIYIPMLFERLGLTTDQHFYSISHQKDAVQYLDYAVTGIQTIENDILSLNNILCGLPASEPLQKVITLTDSEQQLVSGLLEAAIKNWSILGITSVDGLRETFLIRNGLLLQQEDRWELSVEKGPFDMLIDRIPYSFSVIKFPWMPLPLHVKWR